MAKAAKGKPKTTKSKNEQNYVREELKKTGKSQSEIAKVAGVNPSNISKFQAGRTRLSDDAIETLYSAGTILRPTKEQIAGPKKAEPQENYDGKTKAVKEAAKEKGFSESTIRRWMRIGKLNYIKIGRRVYVCIDEKYKKIKVSVKKALRSEQKKTESLRAEVARLRAEIEVWEAEKVEAPIYHLKENKTDVCVCGEVKNETNELCASCNDAMGWKQA